MAQRRTSRNSVSRKKKSSPFASIALFTAAVLGVVILLAGIAALYFFVIAPPQKQPAPTEELTDAPLFSDEDAFTFLFVGTDEAGKNAASFFLIKLDPAQDRIEVASLPAETVVEATGRRDTLAGHFAYGAMPSVREAVNELVGDRIDHYAEMSLSGAQSMFSHLGTMTMTVPEAVNYHSDEYSIVIGAGAQTLDAAQLSRLLRYPGWTCYGRADEFRTEVLCRMLDTFLVPQMLGRFESLYSLAFNLSDTNIGVADYLTLSPVLEYLAEKNAESPVTTALSLSGTDSGGRFTLSEQSSDVLHAEFGRAVG